MRCVWMILALLLVPATTFAQTGINYAFLVSCGEQYNKAQLDPLPKSFRDMNDFRDALLDTGFGPDQVVFMHDCREQKPTARLLPEKAKILRELELLIEAIGEKDTLVVALDGHGLHFTGDTTSYFCPIDARINDKSTMIPMSGKDGLFTLLKEKCRAKRKMLIVGACRNDPAKVSQAAEKVDLDLSDPDRVPEGIVALYSCRPGQKTYFDPDSPRTYFFDHLIRSWKGEYHPGRDRLNIEEVFAKVSVKTSSDVRNKYGAGQVPDVRRYYHGEWLISPRATLVLDLGKGVTLELVRIPAGRFRMGSTAADVAAIAKKFDVPAPYFFEDETPAHMVRIEKDFWMGRTEVTKGQFARFVADTGYETEAEKDEEGYGWNADEKKLESGKAYSWKHTAWEYTDDHPVVNVSWNDAVAFCEWVQKLGRQQTGDAQMKVRLPSEAEWEYAARAGSQTWYHFGNQEEQLAEYENVADGTLKAYEPLREETKDWVTIRAKDGYAFTCPVTAGKANGFGLRHMSGNVWEWTGDWYSEALYKRRPPSSSEGPKTGTDRVLRGGSWFSFAWRCRSAYRRGYEPSVRFIYLGFRLCGSVGR